MLAFDQDIIQFRNAGRIRLAVYKILKQACASRANDSDKGRHFRYAVWLIPFGKCRRKLAISLVDRTCQPFFIYLKRFFVQEFVHFPDRRNWDACHLAHIFDDSPNCDGQIIVLEIFELIAVVSIQHATDFAAAGHADESDLFSHRLIVQKHGTRRFRHAVDYTDKAFALLDNAIPLFVLTVGIQILGNFIIFRYVKPDSFAV